MKKAVALRHVHFEDVGEFSAPLLEHGYQVEYVDPTTTPLNIELLLNADLLIVLGAPFGAFDEHRFPYIIDELAFIQKWLITGKPLLAVCFGAQLVARALGANVKPMPTMEIGYAPIEITEAGHNSALAEIGDIPILHWHGDQFDIPASATRLASTVICPNQAYAIGNNVLGLQFHIEVGEKQIESWIVGNLSTLSGDQPNILRATTKELGDKTTLAAHRLLTKWLQNLD